MSGTTTRRPGRPEIGGEVKVRLGGDLVAAVDEFARSNEITRAQAIRALLRLGLMSQAR